MANGTTTDGFRTRTRARSSDARPTPQRCSSCGAPAAAGCCCGQEKVPCGCGELNCLCRPNWVAGMVLREEDLKRLDTYLLERLRRLNLAVLGRGVVSGLEVRCDPCGTGVVVGCGHAISPCGDDIVVCDDAYVDICELVRKCRKQERADCLPHERPRACPDVEETWTLAIEYVERPADGVLPLRQERGACDCGCDRGGGKDGHGCSCETARKPPDRPRGAPVSCEPRLLCEDFRFRVCPPPDLPPACRFSRDDDGSDTDADRGPLIDRLVCCLEDLIDGLAPLPPAGSDSAILAAADEWYTWLCLIKRHLLTFASRHPVASCDALADLQQLVCLRPQDFSTSAAYLAWLRETFARIALIFIEMMYSCLCSALLPPCPEPATSISIPIATVTVSFAGGGCRVARVCNWTRLREYASSLRNVEYWLSIFPVGREFRRLLECLCCDLLSEIFERDDRDPGSTGVGTGIEPAEPSNDPSELTGAGVGTNAPRGGAETATAPPSFGTARIRERLNQRLQPMAFGGEFDRLAGTLGTVLRGTETPVEPEALLRDFFGSDRDTATLGGSARAAPAETLLTASLVAPFLRGITGSSVFAGGSAADVSAEPDDTALDAGIAAAASSEEMAALRNEIASLRARVDEMGER